MTHSLSATTSLAHRALPSADYTHICAVPVPLERRGFIATDPAALARQVFDVTRMSGTVRTLFALRQRLVRLIGITPAARDVFRVSEVCGSEALIAVDDRHLDFRAAVGSDGDQVRVVTRVRLHGWRGQLYFLPVRLLHPAIVRAMVRSAIGRD